VWLFLYGESGSCLTRGVASGVSWAAGVTQRSVSVTPTALGNLKSAYYPEEKNLYHDCGAEYMIDVGNVLKKAVRVA
jgi:hypothetical protein